MRRALPYLGRVAAPGALLLVAGAVFDGRAQAFSTNLIQLAVSLAATLAAARAARITGRPTWRWFALGAGSFSVGQAGWVVGAAVSGEAPLGVSLLDLFFLAAAPCFVVGTLRVSRRRVRRAEAVRVVADSLIFLTAGGVVLREIVLGSASVSLGTWDLASELVFPLADFLLLVVAVAVLPTTDGIGRRRLGITMAAFLCMTFSDVVFVYQEMRGGYSSGTAVDLGWVAGFALLAVLAREIDRGSGRAAEPTVATSLLAVGFPYVPAVVLGVLLAGQHVTGGATSWTAYGSAAVIVMMFGRELLLHHDVLRLQRSLGAQAAAADLRQQQYWRLVETSPLPVLLTRDARWVYVNPAGRRLLGCADRAPIGDPVPAALADHLACTSGLDPDQHRAPVPLALERADGERREVECHITSFEDEEGIGSQVIVQDVTDRRRAEEQLARQERHWRSLVQNASDIVLVVSGDGRIVETTPATERVLGLAPDAVLGLLAPELVHPDDAEALVDAFARLLGPGEQDVAATIRVRRSDGRHLWMEGRARNLLDDDAVAGIVVNLRDIDEQKRAMDAVRHQAMHDGLTGLANRRALVEELTRALQEPDEQVGLLLLDLDGFKDVNDGLGHEAGDFVLVEIGRRLASAVRSDDLVARLGGDEFAILLRGVGTRAAAAGIGESVLQRLRQRFEVLGNTLSVGGSVGAVSSGEDGRDPGTLLRHADMAMYHAKRHGGGVAVYDRAVDGASVERLALAAELGAAMERGDIRVVFQPKVDARTGRPAGAEALARWDHPTLGSVSPARFVPLAESAGLITTLTEVVLRQALPACKAWRSEGFDVGVAVNLSARLLTDRTLDLRVRAALAEAGLPAHCLTLEITEGALAEDTAAVRETLLRLHALGLRLSIDDFGTGYSSMAYLKRLPIDELKIDRSFVTDLDDRDRAIVGAVVSLGHALGLTIVAEGVESSAAMTELRSLGCDQLQGFGILEPVPAAALHGWLAHHQLSAVG